jgi:predicted GIY-YIG superfamily endonuclease
MHFVYVLRCADNSLYIGETPDLVARLAKHHDGSASTFTAQRRPVTMVYAEEYQDRHAALLRERQLKTWTRRKKEALVAGDLPALKRL